MLEDRGRANRFPKCSEREDTAPGKNAAGHAVGMVVRQCNGRKLAETKPRGREFWAEGKAGTRALVGTELRSGEKAAMGGASRPRERWVTKDAGEVRWL